MNDFFEELVDEIKDFYEDFYEHLLRVEPKKKPKMVSVSVGGASVLVRPAYLFAERIDNLLRIIFGISILISAATSTFIGFSTLSQLLETLIFSIIGRVLMGIIGGSYLIIAIWKLMHVGQKL